MRDVTSGFSFSFATSLAKADTIFATIWEFWCGRDDLDAGYSYHQQGEAQEGGEDQHPDPAHPRHLNPPQRPLSQFVQSLPDGLLGRVSESYAHPRIPLPQDLHDVET